MNKGTYFSGMENAQTPFIRGGKQGLRVRGREYLGSVEVYNDGIGTSGVLLGGRMGLYPISPFELGGQLSLMAQSYQEHKMLGAEVHYEPVVPATTTGAIALFFYADPTKQVNTIGLEGLKQAATVGTFIETPVWEEARMKLKLEDTLVKYFDEADSEARFTSQGVIEVIAASDLEPAGTENFPYGNLFIDYEFEFYDPALDNDVDLVREGIAAIQMFSTRPSNPTINGNSPWSKYEALIGYVDDNVVGSVRLSAGDFVSSGIPLEELPDWIFTCYGFKYTYIHGDGGLSGGPVYPPLPTLPQWTDFPNAQEEQGATPGQGFYLRFFKDQTAGTDTGCAFFADLSSAQTFSVSPGTSPASQDVSPGQLTWKDDFFIEAAQLIPPETTYTSRFILQYWFHFRAVRLPNA